MDAHIDHNQILGYPKYSSSHNIDLSKIVTLSALVEPDTNLAKLKEKIERLKFQIAGQQQEIFFLKKSKLRFSNSVALNEEVQLIKKINSDLRAKVLELSKSSREYEGKLKKSIDETSQIEENLKAVLQENIELKLQLHHNKNEEKIMKEANNMIDADSKNLASEIRELKKQVSIMKEHFEKSFISLLPNSRLNIPNNNSASKWSIDKSLQYNKKHIYEKLNNPIARPKKICGRIINNHLNKAISQTVCAQSNMKTKKLLKKSDDSSLKSVSSDETSESTLSTSSQSNQSNLSENQFENIDSTQSSNSNPKIISNDNSTNNSNVDCLSEQKEIKSHIVKETKSELEEEFQHTTNLLTDIHTCKVKNYFENVSDNEVD